MSPNQVDVEGKRGRGSSGDGRRVPLEDGHERHPGAHQGLQHHALFHGLLPDPVAYDHHSSSVSRTFFGRHVHLRRWGVFHKELRPGGWSLEMRNRTISQFLDVSPTQESIVQLAEFIQAEVEVMVALKPEEKGPKVKSMRQASRKEGDKKVCGFFAGAVQAGFPQGASME